jgi:hypothetical protein
MLSKLDFFIFLINYFQECNFAFSKNGENREIELISGVIGGAPAFDMNAIGEPYECGVHHELSEYVTNHGYRIEYNDERLLILQND